MDGNTFKGIVYLVLTLGGIGAIAIGILWWKLRATATQLAVERQARAKLQRELDHVRAKLKATRPPVLTESNEPADVQSDHGVRGPLVEPLANLVSDLLARIRRRQVERHVDAGEQHLAFVHDGHL